jgi:hypothetical protein
MTFPLIIPIMIVFGILYIIALLKTDGSYQTIAVCVILTIAVFGVLIYTEYAFGATEIKTVSICDKFPYNNHLDVTTVDGNTYTVDPDVYGLLPHSGNVTVEFRTSALDGGTSIDKLISQPLCGNGCGT